jgi:O-antigen/teichoic acid export membrane protein
MTSFNDEAQPQRSLPQPRGGLKRKFGWGLLDQLASSGTNFGLSLFGGRQLGASGLGVIAIGFSAYLIALGFQRALLSEPLVIVSPYDKQDVRRRATRSSISATIGLGLGTAAAVALLGLWLGGAVGRGLLIFAPWLLPALLQDLWRTLLFRDGRGGAATANDAVWLTTMCAGLAMSYGFRDAWVIVACWGLGAMASTIVGFAQLRVWGAHPKASWEWMISHAWPVGRWFVAEGIVFTISSQLVVFLLAGMLGAAAVGGLRSVQVIFAPLSVLGPAASLPGLPLMRKAVGESRTAARTLALKVSVALFFVTSIYLIATSIARGALLTAVFGEGFAKYGELVWPVGVHQLVTAAAGGYYLLLKAHRGGKLILVSLTLSSVATFSLLVFLSLQFGIVGGAWAMTLGASIGTTSIIAFALRVDRAKVKGVP